MMLPKKSRTRPFERSGNFHQALPAKTYFQQSPPVTSRQTSKYLLEDATARTRALASPFRIRHSYTTGHYSCRWAFYFKSDSSLPTNIAFRATYDMTTEKGKTNLRRTDMCRVPRHGDVSNPEHYKQRREAATSICSKFFRQYRCRKSRSHAPKWHAYPTRRAPHDRGPGSPRLPTTFWHGWEMPTKRAYTA